MNQNIFRKSSLERISSPEQLEEYVKNTSPSTWLILLALLCFAVGFTVWAFTATVSDTFAAVGTVTSSTTIMARLDPGDSASLQVGMDVRIAPVNLSRESRGFASGKIVGLNSGEFTVTADLGQDLSTQCLPGTACNLMVIKRERKPYQLILGGGS